MSVSASITITKDDATPGISALLEKTSPARLAKVLRDPLRGFWRDHLKSLPTNKRGWPSTGFWEEAARAVQAEAQDDAVLLRCEKQGVRQRYLGGTINALDKKLTIPISPVSYGHRASEFPGLFLLVTKKGAYLVQRGEAVGATGKTKQAGRGGNNDRRQRANLVFLFKLMDSVTQAGNEDVLPTNDEMLEVAFGAIERSLAE